MAYFASDFANVDDSSAVEKFVRCLELQRSLPFYHYYKRKAFALLEPLAGASLLEVGCGTGEDALALAERVGVNGRVVAIDRSRAMVERARETGAGLHLPVEFERADVLKLPFKENTFDEARVDRTLQHIVDAPQAVGEIARVVRPRGRVVAMEPDWETFTVNSENRQLTRRLLNFWCDSFPSGWVGRNLARYFHSAGLVDIAIEPETLVVRDFALAESVFDLVRTARGAGEAGEVNPTDAENWLNGLRELERAGEFFCSFTAFIVSGKKPDT